MVMVGFHVSAEKWMRKGTRTFWMCTLDAYVAGTWHGCRTKVVGYDGAVVGGNGR